MKIYLIEANITGCKKWHLVVDKNPGMYFVQEDFEEKNFEIETYREEFPDNEVIDLKKEISSVLDLLSLLYHEEGDEEEIHTMLNCILKPIEDAL